MQLAPDRFDEVRREWIAYHQGWSTIQRRRAEQLGRVVRKRQRIRTSAVPDPHDDTLIAPLWLRASKSPGAQLELCAVLLSAVVAPIGWPAGFVVYQAIVRLIPQTLRAFPIAAMLWVGAALGLVGLLLYALCYDPAGTLGQIAVLPWLCLQVATVPVVAGIYGIANGWLAVAGSEQWWPLTPAKRALTAADAAAVLGGYDLTGPGVIAASPLNKPGERTLP
ncbi:hypothetical protein GGC64_006353 [Mycobacterium sp. OAS707]|uniref:hypothetical protein n=1 Tax=Mycobacterium sp. OAS707 TaxID=2663822 RepID=UPI0017895FBF|nr:hypothetical protein [Mycobacterium sp. OAS707]MBE1552266.1 hypothetical protein [Mycobacterium sp. OAS707]